MSTGTKKSMARGVGAAVWSWETGEKVKIKPKPRVHDTGAAESGSRATRSASSVGMIRTTSSPRCRDVVMSQVGDVTPCSACDSRSSTQHHQYSVREGDG